MTKKDAKKDNAKKKAKKPDQLKIAGTERKDPIPAIEEADTDYRESRDAWMEMQEEMTAKQDELTAVMKKHGVSSYVYEGADGKKYEAYLPGEVKAKSRRVKEQKAAKPKNDPADYEG